jgi:hypothetical protein
MTDWIDGFEIVTFPQSPGFPHRAPVTRVVWHCTAGWCAQHAFNVYANAPGVGVCPHITAEYAGTDGGRDTTRYVRERGIGHVPLSLASYALERGNKTHVCHVETNGAGVIQIERVGFPTDIVSDDEHRWLGEKVLAPILREFPAIPPSVYKGPRMGEAEWSAWGGGQCGHKDVCCQPSGHHDPPELDLDLILHFALELNNPPPIQLPETDMILLKVTDDPAYPSGVLLELSGNGIAWVQSGRLPDIYTAGGVRTVDCTKQIIDDILLTKDGVGPPPSTVGSIVHW